MKRNKEMQNSGDFPLNRKKKFRLDKDAVQRIENEYDDRDLSDFTNYEPYEEQEYHKPKNKFLRKLLFRIITLCIVVLLINLVILLSTGRIWFNEPKKRDYPIRGPIITQDMGSIKWESFSQQNIQMAYIRATKSTTFKDEYFDYNWKNAKKTDLPIGALHVFDFGMDGEAQAKHFCETVGKKFDGQLIPAVQVKLYGFYWVFAPDYDDIVAELNSFIKYIEDYYGVNPVIYCNSRTYKKYIEGNFTGCPIWYESLYSKIDESIEWTFWGYTNKVRFSYYENSEEYLYMTVFNGNESAFEKLII